jgi:hypothetical protein
MKIFSPVAHGVIDIAFITVLAMAPIMFDLVPAVDAACYIMAAGYLMLTLATNYRFGIFRLVPFAVHGWLDLLTGIALLVAPLLFNFEAGSDERNLFWLLGAVSVVTWFLTDWKAKSRSLMTDREE